jgi:hypothetical protein
LDSIEEQIGHAVRADLVRRDTGLEEALRRCERAGEAVFLFGADHATVHALRSRIRSAWPRLRLAGICDADFSGPAGPAILAHIAACAPDMVIADVAPKRHRALIAEFASHGLRPGLVNLPGTFVRYLATHPGLADAAAASPPAARLPRPIAKAVAELAAIMRFSGIVARQIFLGAAPSHAARSYQVLRRDG